MTPVAKTGLHCGGQLLERCDQPGDVTPVAKTGLHCGIIAGYPGAVTYAE